MKRFLQYIAEATGPEGRDLSKKVNKHFGEIRGFIGAISGGKANEFQDHVQDGVFSGHDNDTIIDNHGPLKNHGMQTDGDDYTSDVHNYIDAVRAHHEYKTDVRDDSEGFYMGEATKKPKNCGCGQNPCITYGKQEMTEEKGDLKDMKDVVKELKKASKLHLGQSKRLAKYLDSLKEGAAWTKKEGQNEEGGLTERGRKSYERENPGSDLKAPVSAKTASKNPDGKPAKRRKSFCARMGGMKKDHNISCSKDPDKRICKALRKWDC